MHHYFRSTVQRSRQLDGRVPRAGPRESRRPAARLLAWPCSPSRLSHGATASARCTACLAEDVAATSGPNVPRAKCRSRRHQRRPHADLADARHRPRSTTAICGPTGANEADRSTRSGNGSRTSRTRSSGEAHERRRERHWSASSATRLLLSAQQRKCLRDIEARRRRSARSRALTIGFARRFATYKRATLMFRDLPAAEAAARPTSACPCSSSSPAKRTPRTSRARS